MYNQRASGTQPLHIVFWLGLSLVIGKTIAWKHDLDRDRERTSVPAFSEGTLGAKLEKAQSMSSIPVIKPVFNGIRSVTTPESNKRIITSPLLKAASALPTAVPAPLEVPAASEEIAEAIEVPIFGNGGDYIADDTSYTQKDEAKKTVEDDSSRSWMTSFIPSFFMQSPVKPKTNPTSDTSSAQTQAPAVISDDDANQVLAHPNFGGTFILGATSTQVKICTTIGTSLSSANCDPAGTDPTFDPSRFSVDRTLQPSFTVQAVSGSGASKVKFNIAANLSLMPGGTNESLAFTLDPTIGNPSDSQNGNTRTITLKRSALNSAFGALQNVTVKLVYDISNNAWTLQTGSEISFKRSNFESTNSSLLSSQGALNLLNTVGFMFLKVVEYNYIGSLVQSP